MERLSKRKEKGGKGHREREIGQEREKEGRQRVREIDRERVKEGRQRVRER